MSCFEVQILEPSGTILEIQSCAGDSINNLIIEQSPTTSNLTVSQCMAVLPSDINNIIIGQIDNHLTGGSGISLIQESGTLKISTTGLQPSGNYSLFGHQHIISDISGLQVALNSKQPSGIYASGVHNHVSLDITDFDSSVSGLLPVTDIIGGANIAISNSGSIYTVNVSGQLGLTAEQVDDRVSNLLVGGTGISLSYDDNNDILTINTSGLQPSGNYSLVGHQHNISDISGLQNALDSKQPTGVYASGIHYHSSTDITDFNSSVSGLLVPYALLDSPNLTGIPTAPTANSGTNTTQIASTAFVRTEISNLVNSAPATLDTLNELAAALGDDPNFATTVASGLAQKSNIGHTHLSSDITNFNSSVSGLLPVINISAGSGIGISSSSGDFTVSVTGSFGLTSEEVDDRVSNLLIGGSYINLDYNDNSNTLTINASGLQPSGNYSLIGHSHSSSDITDFNNAVSGLIPVKSILSGTGINVSNTSGVYTIEATGSGVLSDQAKSLITTVFNKTGSPIPKMTAVYINGGQGDLPTVSLAIATSDMTSAGTYGLTYEAISNMQSGKVIVFGALTGLDTDQFNPTAPQGDVNGSVLYLSPSVSGALTLTKPSAPNHIVAIGTIVRTHQNEGVIEVRVQNGFELEELHNVAISGVTNGEFLQYNSTSGLWVPSSSGNFSTLQLNGTGVVASSGGNNGYLSKFTSSNTIDNSIIYQSGNNIGIGTTNPQRLIHASGSSAGVGGLFRLQNSSSSNNTYFEVRIGTPGNFDDYIFFNRNGTNFFGATNNSELFFPNTTRLASNKPIVGDPNSNAVLNLYNASAQTELGYVSGNALRFLRSYVEVARFDGNGNFGIGTTTPSGRLDVAGDVYVRGTGNNLGTVYIKSSASTDTSLKLRADTFGNLYLDAGAYIKVGNQDGTAMVQGFTGPVTIGHTSNSNNNQNIIFNPRATERARLTHDGNFGIGTTSPSGKLHVVGTGIFDSGIFIPNNVSIRTSTASGSQFNILRLDTADNVRLERPSASSDMYIAASTAFILKGNDRVGMGHVSPLNRLAVNGATTIGSSNNVAAPTNGLLVEGSVGIGTTTPSGQLHVMGTGVFNSGVRFGDNTLQTTAYVSGQAVPGSHGSTHATDSFDAIPIITQTPSQLTSDQNNYILPSGDIVRLSSDATRTITGFQAISGAIKTIYNVGNFDIRIDHQDTNSDAANRVISSTAQDIVLAPNDNITIVYDAVSSRWRTGGVLKSISQVSIYEFTRVSSPPDASGQLGSYTWTPPANAKLIEIFLIAGGGGGGSGRRGASASNRYGGGGGGSGGAFLMTVDRSLINTALTISIGAGGAGGASVTTDDTNGNNAGSGGATSVTFNNAINTLFIAWAGLAGAGGTGSNGTGGAFTSNNATTFRGGSGQSASLSNLTTAVPGDRAINGPAGIPGAAGGSISTGDVVFTPGTVRNPAPYFALSSAQAGPDSTGGTASTGSDASAGSNGASYGYGGCGGGASANGFASGAGGNGGDGYARITVYY